MVRRKGEISKSRLDGSWPYQVALRADITVGKAHDVVREFCRDLSLAPRRPTFCSDGEWFIVWCFSAEADAKKFLARFGGEMIDPKDRPQWGRWGGTKRRQ